jgi:hypothetical protein
MFLVYQLVEVDLVRSSVTAGENHICRSASYPLMSERSLTLIEDGGQAPPAEDLAPVNGDVFDACGASFSSAHHRSSLPSQSHSHRNRNPDSGTLTAFCHQLLGFADQLAALCVAHCLKTVVEASPSSLRWLACFLHMHQNRWASQLAMWDGILHFYASQQEACSSDLKVLLQNDALESWLERQGNPYLSLGSCDELLQATTWNLLQEVALSSLTRWKRWSACTHMQMHFFEMVALQPEVLSQALVGPVYSSFAPGAVLMAQKLPDFVS